MNYIVLLLSTCVQKFPKLNELETCFSKNEIKISENFIYFIFKFRIIILFQSLFYLSSISSYVWTFNFRYLRTINFSQIKSPPRPPSPIDKLESWVFGNSKGGFKNKKFNFPSCPVNVCFVAVVYLHMSISFFTTLKTHFTGGFMNSHLSLPDQLKREFNAE